uniref:NADH-ubiquinone oxidoreductase chain 1 n=1 Tax=Platynereis bicanaliculata TaxID=868042 RepID=A0A7G8JTM7_9ANNE|nr:NADH dehydrogenase subunit 1 [Platynereis bicanaliculata]QNJ33925.1 NADH dehydrogenase subunit 1 [Platynereis bicanaliculata]
MFLKNMIAIIIIFICALLAMAFFTLLERKILGYIQLRKGPNKVGISGIPQPMADALKLFTKEMSIPVNANSMPFVMSPMLALLLALMVWSLYPYSGTPFLLKWGVMMFLCISSMNVYTTLFSGWASNSKYALLGALRSIAQTISYEVSMALVILSPMVLISSLSLNVFSKLNSFMFMIMLWPLFITWFITTLAETNRTPFDLAEGESELVSGFNTEYSSGSFALIFMAEYMNIIAMGMVTATLFFMCSNLSVISDIIMILILSMISFMFIWVRGAYPRMRYDKLMSLTWKNFLPMSLSTLILASTLYM